jgi:hypothetical protein
MTHHPLHEVYDVYQALTALHRLTRPRVDAAELEPQVGALIGVLAQALWRAYAQLLNADLYRCPLSHPEPEED